MQGEKSETGKTFKLQMVPRITLYQNDGSGRDAYISSNNAGFYKEYRIIHNDPYRKREPMIFHTFYGSNVAEKPIGRYYCDGQGRDNYIFRANARNCGTTYGGLELPEILRNDNFTKPIQTTFSPIGKSSRDIAVHNRNAKLGKELVNRLFYGRCKYRDDRRLSPKVKFAKRINCSQQPNGLMKYTIVNSKSPTKRSMKLDDENFVNGMRTITNYRCKHKHFNYTQY